jgi:hypothetical protein
MISSYLKYYIIDKKKKACFCQNKKEINEYGKGSFG